MEQVKMKKKTKGKTNSANNIHPSKTTHKHQQDTSKETQQNTLQKHPPSHHRLAGAKKNSILQHSDRKTDGNKTHHQQQSWLIQPQPNWYDSSNLPQLTPTTTKKSNPISEASIDTLKKRGELVLNLISEQFAISVQPSSKLKQSRKDSTAAIDPHINSNLSTYSGLSESDKAFIHRILTDGTSSDKLSALILLVSSAPLHCRVHLSNLLNLAKKNNREQAGNTVRALVGWLRGPGNPDSGGLPSDRKLKFFRDQPHLPVVADHLLKSNKPKIKLDQHLPIQFDEWLALWAFEDWFKNWYLDLLRVIESMLHDPIEVIRTQSVAHIYNLLNDKPEQEQNLLTLLVNKLGDREKLICSRTSHSLILLLQVHPLMKSIVVREISSLVLKPIVVQSNTNDNKPPGPKNKTSDHHLSTHRHHDHARYYGAITLNQIPLSKNDMDAANRLIQVYFELFNDTLGEARVKEEQDQKERDDLKDDDELENPDLPSTEKSRQKHHNGKSSQQNSHSSKNNSAGESKKLTRKQILQLNEKEEALAEKNSRLTAAALTGLNRALPFGTIESSVLDGYFETLFRICHTGFFNVSIQALILIQNLLTKSETSMTDRFYKTLYSRIIDHRLFSSTSKLTLYLNLLFKSINSDENLCRVLAFVKRIVQVLPYHQPPFICSTLVLLGHLFAMKPKCRQLIRKGPSTSSTQQLQVEGEEKVEDQQEYDEKKRDPRYAHAENSILWELVPLLGHYHPSVKLNAIQLLKGEEITSTIDLEHHTLPNFLDKFVCRQPKKNQSQKGSAIMQPKLHLRVANVNKFPDKSNTDPINGSPRLVNSKSFRDLDELQVPADEVFLHKFFKKKEQMEERHQKKNKEKKKKAKKSGITEETDFGGRGGSDDGSEESNSEEEEEEVWEAMKRTMDKEMKDEIMNDLSEEDEWSGADLEDGQTDSDDQQLAELLKEDDLSDEDNDDQVEFINEEIDVMDSDVNEEDSAPDDDGDDKHQEVTQSTHKRKKSSNKSSDKKRRKTLKDLPTFASVDQFSHLLSDS